MESTPNIPYNMTELTPQRISGSRRAPHLDIPLFLSTLEPASSSYNELSLVLQSVAKRSQYGALHFHELGKCIGESKLELERAGLMFKDAGNIHDNRTYYEAHIVAFVQNLHAVCDSFPHVVPLMLGPLRYLDKNRNPVLLPKSQHGWSKRFFDAVVYSNPSAAKLHRRLERFMSDTDFLILKGLVNQNKHQYLARILNYRTHLCFEKIEYQDKADKGKKVVLKDVDAVAFMMRCHNKLFPKIFILFWTLRKASLDKNACRGSALKLSRHISATN